MQATNFGTAANVRAGATRRSRLWVASAAFALVTASSPPASRLAFAQGASPIVERHIGAQRARAANAPRAEDDQAIVEGWPLYRTERGQAAFNAAMATLKATDGPAPKPAAFKSCQDLLCPLALPQIASGGWFPPGRIWVAPDAYVLFVQSPRQREGRSYRRHMTRSMRYFVFHEFHNSSRNTDTFDTISSHAGSVFVPFYMSKPRTDASGRRFVVIVQVAPYDVSSIHASNYGSQGPGIEIALNTTDTADPLQKLAGILIANMAKSAAPHLKVVNHRGREGAAFLQAYESRMAQLASRRAGAQVALPFTPAPPQRLATVASARIDQLILPRGRSIPIPVADRAFLPVRNASMMGLMGTAPPEPLLVREGHRSETALAPPSANEPKLIEPVRLIRGSAVTQQR